MKTGIIILIIVGVLALCFFAIKGCQNNRNIVKAADSSRYWKAYGDSAAATSLRRSQLLDSATNQHAAEKAAWDAEKIRLRKDSAEKNAAVNREKTRYGNLYVEYQAAKAKADTAGQLAACDSAFNELGRAKVAVTDLQDSYGSAIQAFGQEIDRRDSTIQVLTGIGQGFRRDVDSLRRANDGQARQNAKLARLAGKHWSVGIGAGVVTTTAGVAPGITLDVHYSIFRF